MIAEIDYNAGNVRSMMNALHRLDADAILTNDKDVILGADKVIFPGVGEASTTMQHLKQTGLAELIPQITNPFLGVCLGLQLMCRQLTTHHLQEVCLSHPLRVLQLRHLCRCQSQTYDQFRRRFLDLCHQLR